MALEEKIFGPQQNSENSREEVEASDAIRGQQSPMPQCSDVEHQFNSNNILSPKLRRATGPRTPAGKRNSRWNALKHGIFASIVLVTGESGQEYELLQKGWFKFARPVGKPEVECVEQIVAITWQTRRILKAQRIEIERGTDHEPSPPCLEHVLNAWSFPFKGDDSARIPNCDSVQIFLQRATDLLSKCRTILREQGFQQADVARLFREFYGVQNDNEVPSRHVRLFQDYSKRAREVPEGKGCRQSVGELLDEINEDFGYEMNDIEFLLKMEKDPWFRQRNSVAAFLVPPEFSEQSNRQWAHLSREWDRTFNRLERLQRMRKGQPGPPTLNVQLNR